MKILMISHLFPTPRNPVKGIFMQRKVASLKKYASVDTIVLSPVPYAPRFLGVISKKWKASARLEDQAIVQNLMVYYPKYIRPPGSWFRPFEGISMFICLLPLVWRLRKQHQFACVLSGSLTDDGFAAYLFGKLFRIKAVSYAIGSEVNVYPFQNRLLKPLTKFLLSKLDLVICVGRGLKENVEENWGHYKSLTFNYIGIALEDFDFLPTKKNKIFKGLFVGGITETKGAFDLVTAVKKISPDYSLHIDIVGNGESFEEKQMHDMIGVDTRLTYHGFKTPEQVRQLFRSSDFFVFPTYTEGCANVLVEAVACGLPIIMTDITPNNDFIGPHALTVKKKNTEQLAAAIVQLMEMDQESRDEMARSSRELAVKRFDDKVAAQAFRDLIESL